MVTATGGFTVTNGTPVITLVNPNSGQQGASNIPVTITGNFTHFTTTSVHATLIIDRALEKPELAKLIEQIDEDLVLSADVPREDFLVNVYQGQEVGFYSDEYRADDEGVVLPDDAAADD